MKFNYFFVNGNYDVGHIYERGYNVLVSYLEGDREIKRVSNHELRKSDNKIFVDSGAFSAFTKGITLNTDKYIEYLNNKVNEYNLNMVAQVDTIPGTYGLDSTSTSKLCINNFLYMIERMKNPDILVPVHHYGESFEDLKKLVKLEVNGRPLQYLCLARSGKMTLDLLLPYLDEAFEIILEYNPNLKVHGLGMSDINLLEKYPFYSSDSSTHLQLAVRGLILIPHLGNGSRNAIVISSKGSTEHSQHFSKLPKNQKEWLLSEIVNRGYTFESLQEDVKFRLKWNAEFLMDLFDNYKLKYNKSVNRPLFVDDFNLHNNSDIKFDLENSVTENESINKFLEDMKIHEDIGEMNDVGDASREINLDEDFSNKSKSLFESPNYSENKTEEVKIDEVYDTSINEDISDNKTIVDVYNKLNDIYNVLLDIKDIFKKANL